MADPRIGTVLRGKYRLDRVIGAGGMAVVYRATHRNHAEFAVKMLHPELSVREDIRSRFLREGYTANAVKHPGAVLVVDDDLAEDGAAFLVMELLDGLSCEQLWGSVGKTVSPELASAIAIPLLDVLAAAHEKGIVHRDIKPANLFLTRSGVVKVLDFGIAKAREALVGAHATVTGMTLGTPAFMAPEQALGRSREIDARTDLWAAGATFFAMASGQLVHDAETANEFLIAAGTRPARSLSSAAPDVPGSIVAVMDRALAFEKADRWPSAAAMRDALLEAHRASFGSEDVERVVAAAVKGRIPTTPVNAFISPAAETRTAPAPLVEDALASPPLSSFDRSAPAVSGRALRSGERTLLPPTASGRSTTERFSTSGAISRDRDAPRARSTTWGAALGITAAVLGALGVAVWIKARHAAGTSFDAGSGSAVTAVAPDAIAPDVRAMPDPIGATARPFVDAASPPSTPATSLPMIRRPPFPLPSRRPSGADAGTPALTCSPPWFLDSAGHKQYKPECI